MMPQIELGSALSSDQGIKFLVKVPFVKFEQLVEELPSFQAQTKDFFSTCPAAKTTSYLYILEYTGVLMVFHGLGKPSALL